LGCEAEEHLAEFVEADDEAVLDELLEQIGAVRAVASDGTDDFAQLHRSAKLGQFFKDAFADVGGSNGGATHNAPPSPKGEKKSGRWGGDQESPPPICAG